MASSTNGKITVPNENLPKEETETEPKRGTKKKLLRIQASLHEESIQMVIVIEILECPHLQCCQPLAPVYSQIFM